MQAVQFPLCIYCSFILGNSNPRSPSANSKSPSRLSSRCHATLPWKLLSTGSVAWHLERRLRRRPANSKQFSISFRSFSTYFYPRWLEPRRHYLTNQNSVLHSKTFNLFWSSPIIIVYFCITQNKSFQFSFRWFSVHLTPVHKGLLLS